MSKRPWTAIDAMLEGQSIWELTLYGYKINRYGGNKCKREWDHMSFKRHGGTRDRIGTRERIGSLRVLLNNSIGGVFIHPPNGPRAIALARQPIPK